MMTTIVGDHPGEVAVNEGNYMGQLYAALEKRLSLWVLRKSGYP